MLPQRPAPPLHFVSDAALLPFVSPSSMPCSVQFSRRLTWMSLLRVVASADRFSAFKRTRPEHPLTAKSPTHSHLLQNQRRFVHCFSTLFHPSRRVDHTKHVVRYSQHVVGCNLSHFPAKFLCPVLDTAARLVSSVLVLRS